MPKRQYELSSEKLNAFKGFNEALGLLNGEAKGAFPRDGSPVNPDCIWKLASRVSDVMYRTDQLRQVFGFEPVNWQTYLDQFPPPGDPIV